MKARKASQTQTWRSDICFNAGNEKAICSDLITASLSEHGVIEGHEIMCLKGIWPCEVGEVWLCTDVNTPLTLRCRDASSRTQKGMAVIGVITNYHIFVQFGCFFPVNHN